MSIINDSIFIHEDRPSSPIHLVSKSSTDLSYAITLRPLHVILLLSLIFAYYNLKSLPFIYHAQNNSTYLTDTDISRTHLLCTLLSAGIERLRNGIGFFPNSQLPKPFSIALGGTSCQFLRELKPGKGYEMWSRVVGWDGKWVFVLTGFVEEGAGRGRRGALYPGQAQGQGQEGQKGQGGDKAREPVVYAATLSKVVFKLGRKTIAPEVLLRDSGLLPVDEKVALTGNVTEPFPSFEQGDGLPWTSEAVEAERQRGVHFAENFLTRSKEELKEEVLSRDEVLGWHTDGTGAAGMLALVAQIAGLRKSQFL